MKLLMTIQPKVGERATEPVLIESDVVSLEQLTDAYLAQGDHVLIFNKIDELSAEDLLPK